MKNTNKAAIILSNHLHMEVHLINSAKYQNTKHMAKSKFIFAWFFLFTIYLHVFFLSRIFLFIISNIVRLDFYFL